MPFSYANPTSGPSAGGIGWFVFDSFSTINPGQTITGLTGTLNDGTTVTFDLTADNISGAPRSFDAVPVPTFMGAAFGTAGYTGISGNAALDATSLFANGANRLTLSNIVVKDNLGNPVPNYTAVVADAETTGAFESWDWTTNGGVWAQLAVLGPGTSPVLTGLGTATATLTGNNSSAAARAYVLTTQNPTQLQLTTTNTTELAAGREGVAIGFATTRIRFQKNIGQRINPADQFVLSIESDPASQILTTGSSNGIQPQVAGVFAVPGRVYNLNEVMAPGSVSAISDYTRVLSSMNATPAGTVPPSGSLPVNFAPALGDDVTFTILNAAPETFLKTVDKAFADIGEVLTYTIAVENPNNFAVNNVLVTDATPAGTTYLGNISASLPFSGTDLSTGITFPTIPADTTATISWQVQVNTIPPVSNPIPNLASVTVPGGTSGITNVVTTQVNTAFVSVLKTVDKVFATVNDTLTYTLTLTNAGNVPASNVVITDAVPAGTSFVPGSVTGAAGAPPTLTLLSPIPAGGSAVVTFQVKIGSILPAPNPIPNTPSVAYTYTVNPANPNGASGNRSGNTVTTLVNAATVTTTKSVDKVFAALGEVLTYTLTLQNTGNVAADNVFVTDPVPSGTTFVPGSVTGAAGTPPMLMLAGPIPAGGNAVVTFQVQVGNVLPEPNPIPNAATIAYTFTIDPENPDGGTGSGISNTVTTQINAPLVSTIKSVDKPYADTGDVLTYTLTLQNTGNTAANNVIITDPVPSGTTFVPGSVTGATGAPPLLALASPIPAGEHAIVTFKVMVADTVPDTNPIPNSAAITFTYTANPEVPDGATGGGTSNTVTTLVSHAEIDPVKSVDKAYAKPGDTLTYTLFLPNTGNAAANNVVLIDAAPAGTTLVPGSVTGATGTLPTLTVTNPIPAGGSATVTFQVKITGIPTVNPIPNFASLSYDYTVDPADPNGKTGTKRSNTVTTLVSTATLTATKSVDKSTAYLGDIITYQLAITNTGNVPAGNVVLTDPLPTGVSLIAGTLVVSVPYSGTLASGLQLTNPVAPGQTVTLSFQVKVTAIPNPNPVLNQATVRYTYTVDPRNPNGEPGIITSNRVCTLVFRYNYAQQISDLTQSVALEQAALSAIAGAEGAKIQKLVALGSVSTQELLCLNQSVADMMDSIAMLETLLRQKLHLLSCQIDGCHG